MLFIKNFLLFKKLEYFDFTWSLTPLIVYKVTISYWMNILRYEFWHIYKNVKVWNILKCLILNCLNTFFTQFFFTYFEREQGCIFYWKIFSPYLKIIFSLRFFYGFIRWLGPGKKIIIRQKYKWVFRVKSL